MARLFELASNVYSFGARNFVFCTIGELPPTKDPVNGAPPTNTKPHQVNSFQYSLEFTRRMLESRNEKCLEWKADLQQHIDEFVAAKGDVSAFVFDIHGITSRILADPVKFGFPSGSGHMHDGVTFVDNIHPTSAVHKILARELATLLAGEDIGEDQPMLYSGKSHSGELEDIFQLSLS